MFLWALLRRGGVAGITALGSLALSFSFLLSTVIWDQRVGPISRDLFLLNEWLKAWIEANAGQNHLLKVLGNTVRTHINFSHVIVSAVTLLVSSLTIGVLANKWLGGTRTGWERIKIAFLSVPLSLVFATLMFALNVLDPDTFSTILGWASRTWKVIIDTLEAMRKAEIPLVGKLLGVLYAQSHGHNYIFMLVASALAMLVVNSVIAIRSKRR